jgi:hypothetical protein
MLGKDIYYLATPPAHEYFVKILFVGSMGDVKKLGAGVIIQMPLFYKLVWSLTGLSTAN